MTAQLIRRFVIAGVTTDDNITQSRETYRLTIIEMMKDAGYVPVLDLDPDWKWSWAGRSNYYNFQYVWQGVYVGEDKAWQIEGVSGGKMIVSTKKNK